jgi:hypothetical protein
MVYVLHATVVDKVQWQCQGPARANWHTSDSQWLKCLSAGIQKEAQSFNPLVPALAL